MKKNAKKIDNSVFVQFNLNLCKKYTSETFTSTF